MAKDPAFLFYPGDWNLGTMHLTLLEKGCYIELLVLQFAKGKFTEAQAKHMLNGSFDVAWPTLVEKFDTDGTFFWNKRLALEKEKRKKFTDSRKSNGSVKKEAKHMPKHMEDANENIDDNGNCIPLLSQDEKKEAGRGVVVYNAEEEILKNQIEFERICMVGKKNIEEGREILHSYHLWLESNEKYPKGKKAVFSGFEGWLLNEKKFNGTHKQSNSGSSKSGGGTSADRIEAARNF